MILFLCYDNSILLLSILLYCLKNNISKRMMKPGYLTLDHEFINSIFSGIKLSFFFVVLESQAYESHVETSNGMRPFTEVVISRYNSCKT